MAYNDFSIKQVKENFNLNIIENKDLFGHISPIQTNESFKSKLSENVPLALAINTGKARSEFVIAFILLELREIFKNEISLFSGIEFNVDSSQHLTGFCDFIISLSNEQYFLTSPLITVVEAKNDNIISGIGQCLAEMVAAQIFNERENNAVDQIYGGITTGSVWKFIKLSKNTIFIDKKEYHIELIDKIMGILIAMIKQSA